MYTAKLTKYNLPDIKECADLNFYGDSEDLVNVALLTKLSHLTKYYKMYVNDYETDLLNKQKDTLQAKIDKLLDEVAKIKKEDPFYLFNKELRNQVHTLDKKIEVLTNKITDIRSTIYKLGSTSYYNSTELNKKFNKLLNNLGFTTLFAKRNSYTKIQMVKFNGNEQEMLEKARKMTKLLEKNLDFTCDLIKKRYDEQQENELSEELTF